MKFLSKNKSLEFIFPELNIPEVFEIYTTEVDKSDFIPFS